MLDALKGLIRRFEGWRSRPYLCPAGVPTIGYGATAYPDGRKVTLKDKAITVAAGEALLDHDAAAFARLAVKYSPGLAAVDPAIADAIADFVYNLGGARYRASTLKRKVDAGDWPAAIEQLRKWVWGGGRKLPGLVIRREAEAALIRQAGAAKAAPPEVPATVEPPPAAASAATLTRAELVQILTRARASGGDPFEALLAALKG